MRRIDIIVKTPAEWTYVVEKGELEIDSDVVRNWTVNE